jgi:hypothetical protein
MELIAEPVWIGQWGEYTIPEELRHVKIAKGGWPDLRQKDALRLLEWAASVDVPCKTENN